MHFQVDLAADGLLSCYKDRPSCLENDLTAEVNIIPPSWRNLKVWRIESSGWSSGEERVGGEQLCPVLDQPGRQACQRLDGGRGDRALNACLDSGYLLKRRTSSEGLLGCLTFFSSVPPWLNPLPLRNWRKCFYEVLLWGVIPGLHWALPWISWPQIKRLHIWSLL